MPACLLAAAQSSLFRGWADLAVNIQIFHSREVLSGFPCALCVLGGLICSPKPQKLWVRTEGSLPLISSVAFQPCKGTSKNPSSSGKKQRKVTGGGRKQVAFCPSFTTTTGTAKPGQCQSCFHVLPAQSPIPSSLQGRGGGPGALSHSGTIPGGRTGAQHPLAGLWTCWCDLSPLCPPLWPLKAFYSPPLDSPWLYQLLSLHV